MNSKIEGKLPEAVADVVGPIRSKVGLTAALVRAGDAIDLCRGNRLHRFNEVDGSGEVVEPDRLHIVVDGAGGFRAIVNPDTTQQREYVGHLADLEGRKLPKYTVEQVERDGVQAVGNFHGRPRKGWIMNDTEFIDYAGYAQLVIPVSEGVDVKREIWHLSSATSVDKAFHETRKGPEVDPNHTEIAAEFARLQAVSPGLRPTMLRESAIGTFSMKWGMPKDEVAEIVDSYVAGSQRKPPEKRDGDNVPVTGTMLSLT